MKKARPTHFYLYDWFAPLYDLFMWASALPFGGEKRLREKALERADIRAGSMVLEVFAGTASMSLLAAEKGAKATALDVTAGMLGVAKEKAAKAGLGLSVLRADASDMPLQEDSFDRVIISMGLHETPQEQVPIILGEALRVLKPGGKLLIVDFNKAEGLAGLLQTVLFIFFEGETARTWVRIDIQGLLSRSGFRDFRRVFLLNGFFQAVTAIK